MYDCQQLQLMYQAHQVKNDNDYTQIKSKIKEEKKWWYGTGVNMSKKNCKTIDLRGAQVNYFISNVTKMTSTHYSFVTWGLCRLNS